MSKLSILFASEKVSDWLDLSSLETNDLNARRLTFRVAKVLHRGERFLIYQGQLQEGDGTPFPAVAKVGWELVGPGIGNVLAHEYNFYNNALKDLQGSIVPRCHGLYQGQPEPGTTTVLLLDYLGEHKNKDSDWTGIVPEHKWLLIQSIIRIHQAGVRHNALDSNNIILIKDGKEPERCQWYIINFGSASGHECRKAMGIQDGAICPVETHFGCSELWRFTLSMGAWRTGHFSLFGRCFAEDRFASKEDLQEFVEKRRLARFRSPDHVKRAVDKIWAYICAIGESGNDCRPREYWGYVGEG